MSSPLLCTRGEAYNVPASNGSIHCFANTTALTI